MYSVRLRGISSSYTGPTPVGRKRRGYGELVIVILAPGLYRGTLLDQAVPRPYLNQDGELLVKASGAVDVAFPATQDVSVIRGFAASSGIARHLGPTIRRPDIQHAGQSPPWSQDRLAVLKAVRFRSLSETIRGLHPKARAEMTPSLPGAAAVL